MQVPSSSMGSCRSPANMVLAKIEKMASNGSNKHAKLSTIEAASLSANHQQAENFLIRQVDD